MLNALKFGIKTCSKTQSIGVFVYCVRIFFLFHFTFDLAALEYTVHQNRVTAEVDHNSFVPATLLVNWS